MMEEEEEDEEQNSIISYTLQRREEQEYDPKNQCQHKQEGYQKETTVIARMEKERKGESRE